MRLLQPLDDGSPVRDITCSVTISPDFTFRSASRNAARVRVGVPFTDTMMSGPPSSALNSRPYAGPSGAAAVTTSPPPACANTALSRVSWRSSCESGSTEMPSVSSFAEASPFGRPPFVEATSVSESLGARARRTANVFFSPPCRSTVTSTVSPGFLKPTFCCNWGVLSIGCPSSATITSPGCRPASFAGDGLGVFLPRVVDPDPHDGALDVARLHELLHHGAGEVDRDREAIARVVAGLARNGRVDADHLALDVHEWAARVAGVDGRVGLDEVLDAVARAR